MQSVPNVNEEQVDDLIVGNAMPEAEQGLNMGRLISLMSFNSDKISGMTVNRYCASGLETIAIASSKIHSGLADCIIAGGAESMSLIPEGRLENCAKCRCYYSASRLLLGHGLNRRSSSKRI